MTAESSTEQNMSTSSSTIVSSAPVLILTYQLPRNPCIFAGDNQDDVNRWLKDYERIATYNHWDEQMRLANVIFYLAGTARQWFDNNEDSFTDWTVFRNSLSNTFCRTDDIRRQAERQLLTRAQRTDESSESYIQDVLALCRKVNPNMTEDEKVAHLMKGIAEDLYQILLVQDYETADAFVKRCRQIESLRRRRIARPTFQRLPNVSTVSVDTDLEGMRSMIRDIVREELQNILPEVQCHTDVSESPVDVAAIVKEEVMEALSPVTSPRKRSALPRRQIPVKQPQDVW